jgi:glycosidase
MSTPFQQLKDNFRAIGKDLQAEALQTAEHTLKEWVNINAAAIAAKKAPAEFNGTLMQWFHWYIEPDGTHWQKLKQDAPRLANAGFTALWLPPAYKGIGGSYDVGYGIYDLFDLGEFDQRGTIRTKYGTKDEYVAAVQTCRQNGIQIYAVVVFNHKMAADYEEEFDAIPYDPQNRNQPLGGPRQIRAWTGFDFRGTHGTGGRGDQYSTMKWHWYHFDSVDYNSADPDFKAVWKMADKSFETKVDLERGNYDMRRIFDGSLMKELPLFAVTLVENHDTQPLQALESIVESWFKPLAYAIILLREQGYPCVFYADYYGAHYRDRAPDGNEYEIWMDSHQWIIDRLLFARVNFAYGPQYDYIDHFNTIGWTRLGSEQHPHAMAVILSDGPAGSKWMEVGKPNRPFYDITGHIKGPIHTNEYGWAEFRCNGGSVSVWVEQNPLLAQPDALGS